MPGPSQQPISNARVLLIDDDEVAREQMANLLRDAGFQVFVLPSPIGASRLIMNEQIDAIVLDVFMPELDGDKSAKMLRENSRFASLGIVLVSGCEPDRLQTIANRVGADAIVSKADVIYELVPTVRAALRARTRIGSA